MNYHHTRTAMLTDSRLKALIRMVCRRRGVPKAVVETIILGFANYANQAVMGRCIESIGRRGEMLRLARPDTDSLMLFEERQWDGTRSDLLPSWRRYVDAWFQRDRRLDFGNCEVPGHRRDTDCLLSSVTNRCRTCRILENSLNMYLEVRLMDKPNSVMDSARWIARLEFDESVYCPPVHYVPPPPAQGWRPRLRGTRQQRRRTSEVRFGLRAIINHTNIIVPRC